MCAGQFSTGSSLSTADGRPLLTGRFSLGPQDLRNPQTSFLQLLFHFHSAGCCYSCTQELRDTFPLCSSSGGGVQLLRCCESTAVTPLWLLRYRGSRGPCRILLLLRESDHCRIRHSLPLIRLESEKWKVRFWRLKFISISFTACRCYVHERRWELRTTTIKSSSYSFNWCCKSAIILLDMIFLDIYLIYICILNQFNNSSIIVFLKFSFYY